MLPEFPDTKEEDLFVPVAPKAGDVKEAPKTEGVKDIPPTEGVREAPKTEGVKDVPRTESVKDLPKTEGVKKVQVVSSVDRARSLIGNLMSISANAWDFYQKLAYCESILRQNNVDLAALKELLWESQTRERNKAFAFLLPKSEVDGRTYDEVCDICSIYRYQSTEPSFIIDRLSAKKEVSDINKLDKEFIQLLLRFRELSLRRGTDNGEFPQHLLVKWYFNKLDKPTKQFMQSRDSYKYGNFDAFRSELLKHYESLRVLD